MIKRFLITSLSIFSILSFNSCEKEVDERFADELLRLKAYIKLYYPEIDSTESGLYYKIIEQGTGNFPEKDNYLLFDYIGMNLDDVVFETTILSVAKLHDAYSPRIHYAPIFIKYKDNLKPLISGLIEGFEYLKEGAKARFIIPSNLAYGSSAYRSLRPYSSVIIDVDFKRIVTNPEEYEKELARNYITENYPDFDVNAVVTALFADGVYILEEEEKEIDDEEEVNDPYQSIDEEDKVSLYYTGRLVDNWLFDTNEISVAQENNIFDSNRSYDPINVKVGGTDYIKGFSLALEKLKTHTRARVIIISENAYENAGTETIPPYSPLVFDLDILEKDTD